MQKKLCIQFNTKRCVKFKINSIRFIARQHVFVSDIFYSKITFNFFSYERKTRIKENDTVNHTNNVIKCHLELKLLIPCFQCYKCDSYMYICLREIVFYI